MAGSRGTLDCASAPVDTHPEAAGHVSEPPGAWSGAPLNSLFWFAKLAKDVCNSNRADIEVCRSKTLRLLTCARTAGIAIHLPNKKASRETALLFLKN